MATETGAGTPAVDAARNDTDRAGSDRPNAIRLDAVSLDDKYDLTKKDIFVTGVQALVRLTMMQKERDRLAGLNTAGFVSGYRGSPLGGLDQQFFKTQRQLLAQDIVFTPGLNEDLAATAVWGTQQAEMRGEGKYDGVFGIWYGKGPGVDRSGDVFRHANLAGSARYGGVLCLMGDDHTAESSTVAHQSEFHFVDVMMPILNPAGAQEILDYGLYGWALSRYSGNWVALKCMKDTVESTGVIDGSVDRVKIVIPSEAEFAMPPGGLSIRPNDDRHEQELRLHMHKRAAALAFVRANKINRMITSGGRNPKIGIITTGKSYLDTRQAFDELGLDEVKANDLGIICSVWLSPGVIQADSVDHKALFEIQRKGMTEAIRKAMTNEPSIDWLLENQDKIVHKYYQMGLDGKI